ncbi:MAG: oligosaccharide flippase family protein [Chloracidobacterium sp.]|nr:oligosaccharide flippase family protein [Chloracidobacterium sp.]
MLNFGRALAFASIAAVLLVNLEKLVLAKVTTVETLAHYAVAFTLATMATMFSSAMIQSLVPAFSQLLIPEKREQLNNLFARALRLNLVMMLPILVTLFVIARPFFTIWAGEEFGRESTIPFYVLLVGVFFNILAYVPQSLLISTGRTDVLAKIYWIELFPYIALIAYLTSTFGAVGAAMAWGTRVFVDTAVLGYLVRKTSNVSLRVFDTNVWKFILTIVVLSPAVLITLLYSSFQIFILFVLAVSLMIYAWLAWVNFIGDEEKIWMTGRMRSILAR